MGLDLENANEIGGNDPEFLKELLTVYVNRFPEYYDTLSEAISKKDLVEVGSRLHRVKSAASVLGYKQFCEDLRSAEVYCLSPEAKEEKALPIAKDLLQQFKETLVEVKAYLSK